MYSIEYCLNPDHTSNNLEATFDFVAKNANKVKRVFPEISSFRQSRNKLNIQFFRLCLKDEILFDLVAKNGNTVEATFDFIERIIRHVRSIRQCCFGTVAGVDGALVNLMSRDNI